MARLCESTTEERSGTIPCDEEGCKLRLLAGWLGTSVAQQAFETHCVLQLRLRAGLAEEPGISVEPLGEPQDYRVVSSFELERYKTDHEPEFPERRDLTEEIEWYKDRRRRMERPQTRTDPPE